MGDAQSAQREGRKDAAEADESGTVDDAPTEQNIEDQSLKNKGQISEIHEKADSSKAEVNGHCEDEIAAEAVLPPDEDVSQTETPLKEETPLENVEINEKESPNEADANEDITLEMTEMDAKENDINESFRRFFGNIGLKLTVKRGSGEIPTDVPNDTDKEDPNRPEDVEDTTKETTSENAEQNTDVNIAQETYDNDSTTCPTLTDITSEDVLENAEENATENKVEVESNNADAAMTSPRGEDANQDTTTEEEPRSTSPSSLEEEAVASPIKRFFTTGIFSGLRKKKKLAEDETTDKAMKDIGKKEVVEKTEQTVQGQLQDTEDISLGVEAAAVETEHDENKLKGEILSAAQKMDASPDPSTIIVTEPEVLSSQEKDKVQASPLKRLLSGSSLRKLSKKPRSRKSSDAKLSDSGEHVSDQLLSSTETAENQKEEGCAQPSTETVGEEDGAWASFKKLMTPKKRMKKSSLSNEETQMPGSVEEPKPSEGGQISDHSTEENKKRKDSSVSWDSVLCRSGRRRSRKTSDSDEETPKIDNDINKQDCGSKHGAESALENEVDEILAYSPKQAGSPSEGDGASTWKSLKRLVTPKRKAKDDDESKDNVQSDSEVTQDDSSFSIKKLLPGRKKRKSTEKQDQVSSDEADKEAASGDEDSDTPAVVPLSEFDTVETEVHIQTQACVESQITKEADFELQQDLLDPMAEPVLPCDNLQTDAKKVQGNDDASENQATTTPDMNEKSDDLTESISKQQLSDIPEEATPASVTEDAYRDDTIAEDLIEITSEEAITAAEHLDITLADETEMISAVSQLSSESSKTSGNTTPVPAEYVVEETDVLLYQVVENISTSPETVPVCSYEIRSERKVFSVSHQILEAFVKPTILELHRSSDTTEIHTGLKVEELDANNELAATTKIASIFEVNDSISTEILSEVPTEEFDTAEITEDEVQEVDVTHPDSVTELESIDESHYLVECLSEVNATGSTNKLPEGDLIVPDKGPLIEAHQTETETPKLDSQETDLAATVADETKDGAMEQEIPSLTHKEDQVRHNITDQIQAEDEDQQPVEVEDLQELANVQALTLGSEKGVPSLEKDIISKRIPADETVTYELKEVPLTEVSVDPEKEDELETDAAKPERVEVSEASEVEQASTLDSEEGSIQSPKEEVKSEDNLPAETVPDEPKQSAEGLTEVSVEPENKELPANAMKTVQQPENVPEGETDEPKEESIPLAEANPEPVDASKTGHVQEPEIFEAVQAPILDSEEDSVHSLEKEVISDNVPEGETVIDEPKQTEEGLTEVSIESQNKELPVDIMESVQEPEVSEAVQVLTLNSEEGSVQSLEKEVISENVPERETGEPKEESIPLTEANPEPVDASKDEHVQELQSAEDVQAPRLDLEEGSVQSPKEEVKSEDIPAAETVLDEPKQSAEGLTEVSIESENKELPANVMETVQEPEVSEAVQAPTLDSEEGSVFSLEKEVISENVPEGETVLDEPKQTEEGLTKVSVDPENKELPVDVMESVQEPEVLEAVQVLTLNSEEGSVQSLEKEVISENFPERETDEPKEETIPLTEENLEPVDASKAEHVQELQSSEDVQAPTLDSEEGSVQSLEKEVISDNVPEGETFIDEPKQTAEGLTEVSIESQNKELPVDVMESVQEPEVSEAVQVLTLNSEEGSVQSLEKEVISENVTERETDEPKEESIPLTEANPEPVDASKAEHVQELQSSEDVQAPRLDSEEDSVQSPKEEVKSEDIPAAETVLDEPKQSAEGLTEVSIESEKKELPANVMETVKEPEVSEAVQAPMLDSEEGSVFSLEKEVISENVPEGETDEPKEESIPLTEANPEPVDVSKSEHVQELQSSEDVQAPILDSEKASVQSFEKEVISDNVPEVETVLDEPKQSAEHLHEVSIEPADASKPEQVQEPEVIQAVQAATLDSKAGILLSLENKVISEDIPEVETVTGEPKQENEVEPEEKPVEAAKTEHDQEAEGLPSDGKEHVTETNTDEGTSMCMHVVTESIEGSSAQEFEKQILFDEVAKTNIDSVSASITDGVQGEGVAQLGPSLERAEDPETESITQDVGVEQEQFIPEVGDELLTLTEVCLSSVSEEASHVRVLEKTVLTEDTPAPCVDNAAATNEPKHEVHLGAEQVGVEGEKESEFSGTEIKTSAVEYAVVAQVVICDIKDVSVALPKVLIERTSPITEPLIERVISEQVFKEEVETVAPLVIDDKAESAEEGSVVVMMHVPLVEFEDNNRIQVQVVNDDIKSAETIVDTVLEVGMTEDKEVIDVCHENVEKVDNFSATLEIEEEIIHEKNKVLLQKVTQHVEENLPKTVPESLVVNLGQEGIEQPDAVTKVSETVESESSEVEDKKEMADSNGYILESRDETSTVISDVAATGKQVTDDLMQPRDITPRLDVSIHDQKDDLEETKAEEEKSETGVAVEEVKSNQMIQKETQMIQTLIVTPTNTGLVDPQNTGVILSIGSVESTSSLSSELQLNIQENKPASPPPVTERSEPVEKTDVSEVAVQAVEVLEPAKTIKQIKVTEVAVQATGTTELAANLESKERAVITTQPVLLDIIQAMEPEERVKARERATSSVQATETMQPVSQTEKGEVSQSQPALSEAYDRETKSEEPAKQKEDQDVWLDAEEDVDAQEKRLGPQTESEREGKAGLEREVEMAPYSKTEGEESQQEMHKTVERRETDSEGEDFAVALEHPETEAASVTTMERN